VPGRGTPGGNPPSCDSKRCRVGPQPGAGSRNLVYWAYDLRALRKRVLLWLVKRGGAEFENSAPVRSELETWPASKPA